MNSNSVVERFRFHFRFHSRSWFLDTSAHPCFSSHEDRALALVDSHSCSLGTFVHPYFFSNGALLWEPVEKLVVDGSHTHPYSFLNVVLALSLADAFPYSSSVVPSVLHPLTSVALPRNWLVGSTRRLDLKLALACVLVAEEPFDSVLGLQSVAFETMGQAYVHRGE